MIHISARRSDMEMSQFSVLAVVAVNIFHIVCGNINTVGLATNSRSISRNGLVVEAPACQVQICGFNSRSGKSPMSLFYVRSTQHVFLFHNYTYFRD